MCVCGILLVLFCSAHGARQHSTAQLSCVCSVCDGFDAAGPDSSDRWMDCEPGLQSKERERENEREKDWREGGCAGH